MKTDFTFTELSKIFAQVDKVNAAVEVSEEIQKQSSEAGEKFDAAFAAAKYTFAGASEEVENLFHAYIALRDESHKAERKAKNAIKVFAEMVGIGEGYDEYYADEISKFIKSKYSTSLPRYAAYVVSIAKRAASKLNA